MSVRGKVWRIIKQMCEFSRSAVLLEGKNDLLIEVEEAGLGVQLNNGEKHCEFSFCG